MFLGPFADALDGGPQRPLKATVGVPDDDPSQPLVCPRFGMFECGLLPFGSSFPATSCGPEIQQHDHFVLFQPLEPRSIS